MTEKAYAKLRGSYDHLSRGSFSEALVAFTGGCPEVLELRPFEKKEDELFERLAEAYKRGSHIGCNTPIYQNKCKQILPTGETYIVSKVLKVSFPIRGMCDCIILSLTKYSLL